MNLEYAALRWLAYEKKCVAVLHERNPRYMGGKPDALGITKSRYLIEIEVKRTISDFKANSVKRHVAYRDMYLKNWPKQFYFLVPENISEKAKLITPEWAGLAKLVDGWNFIVEKVAPVNPLSRRLSVKECCSMFHLLSNQLVAQASTLAQFKSRFQEGHYPFWWNYEI